MQNIEQLEIDDTLLLNTLFFTWLIVAVFEKIPNHDKLYISKIDKINDTFSSLTNEQIKMIKENINIYRKNHSKKILVINAVVGLFGSIYFFFFEFRFSILAQLEEIPSALEIGNAVDFTTLGYLLVWYFLVRSYSKIYNSIFDIIELSANNAIFKKSSTKNNLSNTLPRRVRRK
ncbi:hypothetical protein FGF1_01880 [Flavobacteriaceae bacterium GF1]